MDVQGYGIAAIEHLARHVGIGIAILDSQFGHLWSSASFAQIMGATESNSDSAGLPSTLCAELKRRADSSPGRSSEIVFAFRALNVMVCVTLVPVVDTQTPYLVVIEKFESLMAIDDRIRDAAAFLDVKRLALHMQHDIKTPLNALTLQLALLDRMKESSGADAAQSLEFQRSTLSAARREIKRIDQMVDRFVEVWRDPEVENEAFELVATLENIIEELRPVCRLARVGLRFVGPRQSVMLTACRRDLRHGFTNLLLAALEKYSDEELSIELGVDMNVARVSVPRANVEHPGLINASGPGGRREIRGRIALMDLKSAGATVLATERGGRTWYEIEFSISTRDVLAG